MKEVDNDKDGLQDSLNFEVLFFTDKPIRSLMLLLFFNYELKVFTAKYFNFKFLFVTKLKFYVCPQERIHVIVEAMSIIEYTVAHEVQELYFIGDLMLRQNNVLLHDEIYYLEDNSTDLNFFTLSDLLVENTNRLRKKIQCFLLLKIK